MAGFWGWGDSEGAENFGWQGKIDRMGVGGVKKSGRKCNINKAFGGSMEREVQ